MKKSSVKRVKYGPREAKRIRVRRDDGLKLVLRFYPNGLSYNEYHAYADQIVPDTELFLVPHKDNHHDNKAIGVHVGPERDSPQIGWVPAAMGDVKSLLFNLISAGLEIRCKVLNHYRVTSSIVAGVWVRVK